MTPDRCRRATTLPHMRIMCSAPPVNARGNKSRSLLAAPDRCRCPTNLPHMERMLAAGLGVTRGTGFMPVSRVCRMAPDRYPTWVWCAAQDGPLTLLSPGRPPQPGTATHHVLRQPVPVAPIHVVISRPQIERLSVGPVIARSTGATPVPNNPPSYGEQGYTGAQQPSLIWGVY